MTRSLPSRALRRCAVYLSAALVATACGDGVTVPSRPFEPEQAAAVVDSVVTTFDANTGTLASLELVGEALVAAGGAAAALLPGDGMGRLLPGTAAMRRIGTEAVGLPLFPSNLLGTTFVYDSELGQYVVDEGRAGAPSNGIRFLYYAIDPVTRRPTTPLNELGYLDLTDEGDAAATRLGVALVRTAGGITTLADYVIAVSFGETASAVTIEADAEGYISDGVASLELDLHQEVRVSQTETMEILVDYLVTLPSDDLSLRIEMETTISADVDAPTVLTAKMTVADGSAQVVLAVTIDDTAISGTLKHNSTTLAVVSGDAVDPDFTKPNGDPLTDSEVAALMQIWDAVEQLAAFAAAVFSPFSPTEA